MGDSVWKPIPLSYFTTMARDFKGVWIPKEVWLHTELSLVEKCLLVEINSLDNDPEKGCFASNAYFAEFFQLSESRIANILSSLKKRGFIRQVFFDGRNRGLRALIQQSSFTENSNSELPKKTKRSSRKREHNNTVSKNTDYRVLSSIYIEDKGNEKIGEAAKEFETYGEPESIKKEKKKTPPSSASTPPRPANIEYQMLEAYAQFVEPKGIPVSRNKKGHVQFDKRAFKSCKDWAVWASGMPNASDTLNDWQQFLEAAWSTGAKWLLANFEPNILYSKRTNIVTAIGAKQAKANELLKSDGFVEKMLGW